MTGSGPWQKGWRSMARQRPDGNWPAERALATDPALLLLDEPAAGLRHHEKQALAEVLRQLKAEGMSLLLVEHDMDFVMSYNFV